MSVSYLIGALCFSTFPPLNESQEMGEEWELHLGGGIGKVDPAPKGRQTIALDVVLGLGELGRDTSHSHPPFLCPYPGIRHGASQVLFLTKSPYREPLPCLSAPVLLCFSGMCFHLKTTLGRFLFPVLKIEKFLQYKQGCGGGGVGAVRGHSECILALGWDGWGGRTPTSSPPQFFF